VNRAREAFASVLAATPDDAPAHIGLANALALGFEATRASDTPDLAGLLAAVEHAREACRLAPDSGEAWATLAFVLSRTGGADGVAAGRRATALEPDNWRHHLRLAYGTWGEERLRAAHRAAKLLAGLGLAHWLAATVHVARQAFDEAVQELTHGTEAQDGQHEGGRFNCVGLHLLLGLVRLAQGDADDAEDQFRRELTFEPLGHIYTGQACATAWLAIGAIRLRAARTSEAVKAFTRALECVPGQLSALAAMSVVGSAADRAAAAARLQQRIAGLHASGAVIEAAIAGATADALEEHHAAAADRVHGALQASAAPTSAGWTIPVDPLLQVQAAPEVWRAVLAALRRRAA
jgi:tetratricopeptide (TPR) repeat protein